MTKETERVDSLGFVVCVDIDVEAEKREAWVVSTRVANLSCRFQSTKGMGEDQLARPFLERRVDASS